MGFTVTISDFFFQSEFLGGLLITGYCLICTSPRNYFLHKLLNQTLYFHDLVNCNQTL